MKTPQILTVEAARSIMADSERLPYRNYSLPAALVLFAGIRPGGELPFIQQELSLGVGKSRSFVITDDHILLGGQLTKSKQSRCIPIPDNLKAWLRAYPPTAGNFNITAFLAALPGIRRKHQVPPDGLRQSFLGYFAQLNGTTATALVAGHSEAVLASHYSTASASIETAMAYFSILPLQYRSIP